MALVSEVAVDASEGSEPDTGETPLQPDTGSAPEQVEEPQPEGESEGSAPTGETEGEESEPEEWRNLTGKLGIAEFNAEAKAKLAREYWEGKGALSQLAREKEALQRRVEALEGQPRQTAAKPEIPPTPPPDLQKLDTRINALKSRQETLTQQREGLLQQYQKTYEEYVIARHNAQNNPDEFEKVNATRAMSALQRELSSIKRQHEEIALRLDSSNEDIETLAQQREVVERTLDEERARLEAEEASRETFQQTFAPQVFGMMDQVMDSIKVPNELRPYIKENARAELAIAFHQGKGRPLSEFDVPKMVHDAVKRQSDALDLAGRSRLKQQSAGKAEVAKALGTPPRKPGQVRTQTPTTAPSRPPLPYENADNDPIANDPTLRKARERLSKIGL